MAVLLVILRHQARILSSFLAQEIHNIGLLQQIVSFVLLVGQDFPDAAVVTFGLPVSVRHAVRRQVPCDPVCT